MISNQDTNQMIDLIVSAYGDKAFPVDNPKKLAKVMNLWAVMFRDDDPKEVLIAVKNCISTLQFPPKIADIKSRIAQNRMAGQMTEMEAWIEIRKAVKNATTYKDANEAFISLPKILQKLVGEPSTLVAWNRVSIDTFEGVIASNTQRSYKELAKREAEYYSLPKDLQTEQAWLIAEQKEVTMLPEPKPQKSIDEMMDDMDKNADAYREDHAITPNADYSSRVDAFRKPMTKDELLMHEAKEKRKDKLRMNSWR